MVRLRIRHQPVPVVSIRSTIEDNSTLLFRLTRRAPTVMRRNYLFLLLSGGLLLRLASADLGKHFVHMGRLHVWGVDIGQRVICECSAPCMTAA